VAIAELYYEMLKAILQGERKEYHRETKVFRE
jgi:hypothetical protein